MIRSCMDTTHFFFDFNDGSLKGVVSMGKEGGKKAEYTRYPLDYWDDFPGNETLLNRAWHFLPT